MSSLQHVCIACSAQIKKLYKALMCEECNRWQHLRCGTGITQSFYWKVAKYLGVFEWSCTECRSTAPVSNLSIASAPSQSTASVSSRSTARVSSRSTARVSSRSTAPVSSRSTSPASSQSTAPVSKQVATPVSNRSRASAPSRSPVSRRSTAPVSSRSTAPVSRRPAAPVSGPSSAGQETMVSETMVSDPNLLDYVTYELLEEGSSRGNPVLVSSDGYDYSSRGRSRWVCRRRTCRASVRQRGGSYHQGRHSHNHKPQLAKIVRRNVIAKAKTRAVAQIPMSNESVLRAILATDPNDASSVQNLYNLTQIIMAPNGSTKFTRGARQ